MLLNQVSGAHRHCTVNMYSELLKIIGKEFQKNYYKTIFRQINTEQTFLPFTVISNKDYFFKKKVNLRKFTVTVYVSNIYGHWSLVPITD